jgi:hypothetical protein
VQLYSLGGGVGHQPCALNCKFIFFASCFLVVGKLSVKLYFFIVGGKYAVKLGHMGFVLPLFKKFKKAVPQRTAPL